jgi:hypothetical protein
MRQVVATELKRSPALLALDLTEVNRQTATRKRQNGGTGSAAAGPVSTPQDYPAAQRFWCAELHLSACNVPAQLLTQVTSQRLAQPCHLLQRRIVDRLTRPAPQFAEEQLAAHGAAATVRAAHARHFAGREADILALWDSPRQREAHTWFTAELANLRTAFRWAADEGDVDVAAAIATYAGSSALGPKIMSRSPGPKSSWNPRLQSTTPDLRPST